MTAPQFRAGEIGGQAELDNVLRTARGTGDVEKVVNYVRASELSSSRGCRKPPAALRKPKT